MEGQSDQENPPKMMPSNSRGSGEDSATADGKIGNGSQGTCLPEPFHNYVEYLTEASPYLPNTTAEYVLGSCYPPVGSLHDVNGVNGTDRNFFYNDPGKACCFKAPDSSAGIDFRKVGFWRPNSEGHQSKKFATNQPDHHSESQAPWKAESTGDKHSASKLDRRVTGGEPGFLPKSRSSSSKQKAMAADRQRRQRIADNLKALHDLLPAPAEGCSTYILDDIIDYVKYLQLQIKVLSGSRLQGESPAMPLTFREGYGHYISQQMLNEPLEEMMGKLVEENPAAAAQLLESKGLYLLPLTLVEDLRQAMQMFGGNPRV
ncbi:transcription factor bHLH7-like isoform X2 [Prosopis cineraria]|uniref:transcription factor bHLH7-like isoform X2 n=1 Tax=Prosopis cineraria TaxID=364024 RepID=UPI00240F5996|nr:transcription factor bHLH7-like isoform X2 [Prosopis cineraria]